MTFWEGLIGLAYELGFGPSQLYDMELWELNACVKAYNRKTKRQETARTVTCWQTAAMSGAAFAGKLKPLNSYIRLEEKAIQVPKLAPEQITEMDARFAAARKKER